MRVLLLFIFLSLAAGYLQAQDDRDTGWNIKFGTGAAFHGTGDITTMNQELELGKRINRILSGSAALNAGFGFNATFLFLRQKIYYTHLDANVFASPFGNTGVYHFKIGTGPSLLYVRDITPGEAFDPTDEIENRFTLGFSVILEQEVQIRQRFTLGLKFMTQPYLNGDIVHTLNLKFGTRLY